MFIVRKHSLQLKSKRRKRSSLSCFDDFVKRLQNHAARFEKHLTTLRDKTRNKLVCLNDEKKKKKLHLVLDLDHTLIYTVLVSDLSEREKYLLEEADSRQDLWRCNIGTPYEFIIKLRPFLHEFLLEANKLFTMHVYTMGNYCYAQDVLKLIDPDKVYFGNRVITREASPCNKTLDLLVADTRRVVIVDDTISVWPHHKRNLLQITKYIYFKVDGTKWNSYAEAKKDESRSKGSLANVLKFLEDVHKRFEEKLDSKDLRLLIPYPCRQCCF
ncbi:HAD-like superfamily [Arabidopsis suecica]|uniref:RNA polymerase II C-terminal domain phosphatase-like n=1 Tax=Arabidopsis suecica TaxID=45249 RepID=A0A8T2CMV3_ARASU|nr:HAD-like superfamily [Arabidopsis suecica]